MTAWQSYASPVGELLLAADEEGLTGLWLAGEKYFPGVPEDAPQETPVLEETKRWLDIYFAGREPDFLPPLHLAGSPFRQEVWALLRQIPYGETTTYRALAEAVARKRGLRQMSAQAVGGAVGHNPISIIVPCHRVVGSGGSLFCVVPRDLNATLAVNRIRWNPQNEDYDNLEVLYRSESGEPILLYACADMGESPYPDTEVIVTDSKGRTITWYPIYGAAMLPYDFDNDAPIGYDFTDYGGEYDGDIGWTYPTAEQLANVWVWEGYKDDQYSFGTLTLHANGNAALTWWYEKDAGKAQEDYEGTWKLQGKDSDQLALKMTLVGGERYKSGSTVQISGAFPVQVPLGFEDFPILNIAEGANGELLPFQVPPSTLIYLVPAAG